MPTITIPVRGTKDELKRKIYHLPRYISGTLPDVYSIGKAFKSHFSRSLFQTIHSEFLIKSEGGTDSAGIKWKPNSRQTIAQRPLASGEFTRLGLKRSEKHRGLLTLEQDKLWKGIFRSTYLKLLARVGDKAAKAEAGKLAWAILKSRGAKTKLDILGSRKLPIGIDTHRLEKSIRPGRLISWDVYSPPEDQRVKFHRGSIDYTLKVPYALKFHSTRPIWPSNTRLQPWLRKASHEGLKSLMSVIPNAVRKK